MKSRIRQAVLPPVFLFQMGKVGSQSLQRTLGSYWPGLVVHAHDEQSMTSSQRSLLRWRKRLRLPIYVICPVREPLSRNVSAFFQNFKRDTGMDFEVDSWTTEQLLEMFIDSYPHNVCLEWFDRHLRTTFGIDVFAQPFPQERKWQLYRNESIRLLVYRSDLDTKRQLEVLSSFLHRTIPDWVYGNRSADKEYGATYRQFLESARLPPIYVSIMCSSRFCRHFWSPEEIDDLVHRWSSREPAH